MTGISTIEIISRILRYWKDGRKSPSISQLTAIESQLPAENTGRRGIEFTSYARFNKAPGIQFSEPEASFTVAIRAGIATIIHP